MARSTKTKHVMDLVGAEPVKKPAAPKSLHAEKVEKTPPVPKIVETIEQQQEQPVRQEETRQELIQETPAQSAPVQEAPAQVAPAQAMPAQAAHVQAAHVQEASAQEAAAPQSPAEEKEPVRLHKPMITAIVCELINQELGSVAERFHLNLTDANLWALTRAALEEVRPEFSADSDDREEKLERLRPQVIGAMAKVAIKIAAKKRN